MGVSVLPELVAVVGNSVVVGAVSEVVVVEKDWKAVAGVAVEMLVAVKDWVLVAATSVEVVVLVGKSVPAAPPTVAGIEGL